MNTYNPIHELIASKLNPEAAERLALVALGAQIAQGNSSQPSEANLEPVKQEWRVPEIGDRVKYLPTGQIDIVSFLTTTSDGRGQACFGVGLTSDSSVKPISLIVPA